MLASLRSREIATNPRPYTNVTELESVLYLLKTGNFKKFRLHSVNLSETYLIQLKISEGGGQQCLIMHLLLCCFVT